jgi:hypothetical protein
MKRRQSGEIDCSSILPATLIQCKFKKSAVSTAIAPQLLPITVPTQDLPHFHHGLAPAGRCFLFYAGDQQVDGGACTSIH